jgi:hypothetical protein
MGDDEGGEFDTQYNRLTEEKMGEWKRSYYKVCSPGFLYLYLRTDG